MTWPQNSFKSLQQENQEDLWYYCKKSRYTKDTCFKLHDKETVLSCTSDFRNLHFRNQSPEKVAAVVSKFGEFSEDEEL